MESQKSKNVLGVAKNPIGVIGLFLVLVEAIAALVVVRSSLPYSLNLILVLFIVIFPLIVLLVFYILVTKHHEKLYSPSDFKDEKNFVKTYNSATQTEEYIEANFCDEMPTAPIKEGMTIDDINIIKDSLNTIVDMQKSLSEKNQRKEESAIVERAEKTINERLESYVIEKESEYKTSVSYIYGSREFVNSLNRKGYYAEIYFTADDKRMLFGKNSEHEAIWLGKKVPSSLTVEIIKMAKEKFPHLKYIDFSSDYAPEYIQYQNYIGGATSTALERKLKELDIADFEKIYECQSEQELYKCITDLNSN